MKEVSFNFFWSAELSQIYRRIERQEGRPDKKLLLTEYKKKYIKRLLGI